MEPPENDAEAALELASLIEETISDNALQAATSARHARGMGGVVPRNNNDLQPPSRSSHLPNNVKNNKPMGNGLYLGYFSRQALLLLNLSVVVLLLLLLASKTENELGTEAAETTFEVHHKFSPFSSKSKPSSSNSAQSSEHVIGFHEASLENIYGANHYYKPKGVGYSIAPKGGLHPIYMAYIDIGQIDETKGGNNSTVYYNDDYELSPYADERLKLTDKERLTEQQEWSQKLKGIRTDYGYWNFQDDYSTKNKGKARPVVDWETVGEKKANYNPLLGEIDPTDFPKDSWQTDDAYIANFLTEGKALIKRVQRGIYREYGWETDEDQLNNGGVTIPDATVKTNIKAYTQKGIAWMYEDSYNGLVKKLLNAMITNDHFFVTLGGHSAAAGHGNNFWQSYMMEFQRIMEPVFDRLGMVLVSANLAQGGMGTLQAALAGGGVYGAEGDFILWDSSMTEKDVKAQDLFFRQALLAGQRVPILFDLGGGKAINNVNSEEGAHIGGTVGGNIFPKFKTDEGFDFQEKKYNAACWTDRVDIEPPDLGVQNPGFGGQASWHPGNWVHQSTARKITLLFLHALEEALTQWERIAAEDGGNPLDGKHWHLQAEEDAIRDKVKKTNGSMCGALFEFLPRVCTTPMRGATEWSPRSDPEHSNIRSLIKAAPNGYVPGLMDLEEQAYPGRDPKMPSQRVFPGEVDVATIARSLAPRDGKRRRSLSSTAHHYLHTKHPSDIDNRQLSQETSADSSHNGRFLEESKINPGEGWAVAGHPSGFCDGTSNAVCYREKTSHCLMSGHNDARGIMTGDGLSGWLIFELKDVTEGMFISRMETWHQYNSNKNTEGWEAVNNGRVDKKRKLKAPPPPLLPSFLFEVAVNGDIVSSWNSTDFQAHCHGLSYNNMLCVLWDDDSWNKENKKEDVELAIRLGGPDASRKDMMAFTHIYYA